VPASHVRGQLCLCCHSILLFLFSPDVGIHSSSLLICTVGGSDGRTTCYGVIEMYFTWVTITASAFTDNVDHLRNNLFIVTPLVLLKCQRIQRLLTCMFCGGRYAPTSYERVSRLGTCDNVVPDMVARWQCNGNFRWSARKQQAEGDCQTDFCNCLPAYAFKSWFNM
jgi:hypothetical protein